MYAGFLKHFVSGNQFIGNDKGNFNQFILSRARTLP